MLSLPVLIKPRAYAETMLLEAILEGEFAPGSQLPGERDLAVRLGVTRPTLREAIQRLARDGWLTVAQGKPTVVNNYWEEGGLNVLGRLVEHQSHLPPDFISRLLEVRLHLAPAYTRAAVDAAGEEIAAYLERAGELDNTAEAYARFDWRLHRLLTIRSGNPIYTLILNGFRGFYEDIGCQYFASAVARDRSREFYRLLGLAAANRDGQSAENICRRVMLASIDLWEQRPVDDKAEEI